MGGRLLLGALALTLSLPLLGGTASASASGVEVAKCGRQSSGPVAGGECEAPRVLVPRLLGLTRSEAIRRLRDVELRPAAYSGALRYEPAGYGFDRRIRLVRAHDAGQRKVTIQDGFPARVRLPAGSSVGFGTQPAPGPFRFLLPFSGGESRGLESVSASRGGRRLTLGLDTASGGCGPLDHVDVALREKWVLLTPFAIAGEEGRTCRGRARHRRAELRLPAPLRGRPVLERPPNIPNPSLAHQYPTRFDAARASPNGRSVVVYYTYGACAPLAGSRVAERREEVEITLLLGDDGRGLPCAEIAYFGLTLVRLPSPLGDRRIVDGAS
jgi:hypothetical protein